MRPCNEVANCPGCNNNFTPRSRAPAGPPHEHTSRGDKKKTKQKDGGWFMKYFLYHTCRETSICLKSVKKSKSKISFNWLRQKHTMPLLTAGVKKESLVALTTNSSEIWCLKNIHWRLRLALKGPAHLISTTYSDDSHTLQCFDPLFSGSLLSARLDILKSLSHEKKP